MRDDVFTDLKHVRNDELLATKMAGTCDEFSLAAAIPLGLKMKEDGKNSFLFSAQFQQHRNKSYLSTGRTRVSPLNAEAHIKKIIKYELNLKV